MLTGTEIRVLDRHIERGDLLDILEHPNPSRYAGQRIFVVRREDYVCTWCRSSKTRTLCS